MTIQTVHVNASKCLQKYCYKYCVVPTCPPLTAPDNGNIDCSLGEDGETNPGDTCTFTCDDGYELGGSTSRTCGDDGNWDGTDTTCTESMLRV